MAICFSLTAVDTAKARQSTDRSEDESRIMVTLNVINEPA
jgi:hypothetical protein